MLGIINGEVKIMNGKKFFGFIALFVLLIGSVVFAACSDKNLSKDNFKFSYVESSAKKVESEQNYVSLKLKVKNTLDKENTLSASKFYLNAGGQKVSSNVYFGNNIIDKMESETFEKSSELEITINLFVSELDGEFSLWYDDLRIKTFKV